MVSLVASTDEDFRAVANPDLPGRFYIDCFGSKKGDPCYRMWCNDKNTPVFYVSKDNQQAKPPARCLDGCMCRDSFYMMPSYNGPM